MTVAPERVSAEAALEAVARALTAAAGRPVVTVLPAAANRPAGGPADGAEHADADDTGWRPLHGYTDPAGFTAALERAGAGYGGARTPVERAAAASLLCGDLASALALPLVTALVAQRRALLPHPDDVRLRVGGGVTVGVGRARLLVLPQDVLAGVPGVEVVPHLADLRRATAAAYAQLVDPLVRVTAASVRRGRHAMWAECVERLAAAVLLVSQRIGRPHDAPAECRALLAGAPAPLRLPVSWVDVPRPPAGIASDGPGGGCAGCGPAGCGDAGPCGPAGDVVPWKRRTVCCLAYQTPRFAGELCATCPRVPQDETVRRMADWLRAEQPAS